MSDLISEEWKAGSVRAAVAIGHEWPGRLHLQLRNYATKHFHYYM